MRGPPKHQKSSFFLTTVLIDPNRHHLRMENRFAECPAKNGSFLGGNLPMRTLIKQLVTVSAVVGLPAIGSAQDFGATANQGSIRLVTANAACGAITPEGTALNPNPTDLNDGDLDDAEVQAIQEGCTFRARITSSNGTPISGVQLRLERQAAPVGSTSQFGYPRTTDSNGEATWRFQPSPDTDFIYEAAGDNMRSNHVELQLCTGSSSVGSIEGAPQTDSGQGCQNVRDSADINNNSDNNLPELQ